MNPCSLKWSNLSPPIKDNLSEGLYWFWTNNPGVNWLDSLLIISPFEIVWVAIVLSSYKLFFIETPISKSWFL